MKTKNIIPNKKTLMLKWFMFCLLQFVGVNGFSQIQNNSNIHIADNGTMYIHTGDFYTGIPSSATTSRNTASYGKIIFESGTSFIGASDTNYIDGYVTSLSTSLFIFPIGQSGIYAPIGIISNSNTGIDAVYNRSNPITLSSHIDSSLNNISNLEYWIIKSATSNAKISLTWRNSSNIVSLIGSDLSKLAIAGWNGNNWIEIPSSVDANSILNEISSTNSGSITTDQHIQLSNFQAFTLASKGDCASLASPSGIVKTWNGSWSTSEPSIYDSVIINAPYNGNLSCNSLVLNDNITIGNNQYVEVINDITGNGQIIMGSEASLVQRNSNALAPNIQLTKQTRPMRRYDYVHWGSPVKPNPINTDSDFFLQLATAQATTSSNPNAFDLKYIWQAGTVFGWQTLLNMPNPGNGFIMRVKAGFPYTNSTSTDRINLKFTGVANNGDVTTTVYKNSNFPNGSSSHNLLANPYSSAIDGDMFLRQNNNIDGVIYIWKQANDNGSSSSTTYSQADYLTYTRAGYVTPSPISETFNGIISSGQGFLVKALNDNESVTFTNCMRLTGNNNAFFRNANTLDATTDVDRFKLTMIGDNGVYSQMLIAYSPNTSLNYDRMYDACRNSTSTAQLYSILESDGRKLAINARPDFFDTDVVPIGISKSNTDSELFTINIEQKEGIFNINQNVYLHDKILNIFHDFQLGNYTFSTNSTSIDDRFEIVYQTPSLNNQQFISSNIAVILNKQMLSIKSSKEMKKIDVFDVTGKNVASFDTINSTEFKSSFIHPEGFYFLKIRLQTDEIVTEKLINSK